MFTKADIEKYFLAEKNAALFFLILGMVAIIASFLFFFIIKTNWYKGFAIPLLAIGIIQGIVGFQVYKTADEYRKDNVFSYDLNPAKLKTQEWPRMQKVKKQFTFLLIVEALLFFVALAMVFGLKNNSRAVLWHGLAFGLMLQMLIAFGFDWLAQNRAKKYVNGLRAFIENNTGNAFHGK